MTIGHSAVTSRNYLLLISSVAAIYFLFGLLGLLFKVSPSNAGSLWPPAGVSLAAMLIYGRQVWPGVFLGNFCVSAYAFGVDTHNLLVCIATGFGASLSATAGYYLIKRFIGLPTPLITDKSILLFFFLGGPLSSLISSTIGITSMYWAEVIVDSEVPLNWLSWWAGDTIGVFVFTPIILSLLAQPQQIWRQRLVSVAFPLLLTFILVVSFYLYVRHSEQEQYRQQLKEQSVTLSQSIKNRIQNDLNAIHALKVFAESSPDSGNSILAFFAKQALGIFPEILAVRYVDSSSIRLGKIDFISLLNGVGQFRNDENLIVKLNAFLEGNFAKTPDDMTVGNDVIELLTPVYVDQKLRGVIFSAISIPSLLTQAFEKLNSSNYLLTITTQNKNLATPTIIFSNLVNSHDTAYQQVALNVANQQWLLNFYHNSILDNSRMPWSLWWVLVSGLLFTSLLGIGLLALTGRYFQTEIIVKERTSDLMKAKIIAESANKEKSQFLAKISHELRTPLNGILGFTRLLQKRPSISDEDRKKIDLIRRCGDDLLTLINDLLDISTIESNQIRTDINNFRFDELLRDIIEVFKFQVIKKQLKLEVNHQPVNQDLRGDDKRIRQIIVNLLNNAIKYTAQGVITISSSYQDGQLKVTIQDTGRGIAKGDLESIFSPFVQINTANVCKEGVGLGLAITKELVNAMKGTLSVNSEVGVGSIFSVTLPLPTVEKSQKAITDYTRKTATLTSVLVVDDNDINLLLLTNMLEQQGYRVDAANNGTQALELRDKNNYAVALIDLDMPVMSGFELLKALRARSGVIKIVAVSAYVDTHKKSEALAAGFDFYLTKPIDEDQLLPLLQNISV